MESNYVLKLERIFHVPAAIILLFELCHTLINKGELFSFISKISYFI